ncbi:MAG: hypothetical protein KBT67_04055 [bacterium]|nr:hypothetical protein [Candidatus Limimorpha caballi]
MKEILKIKLERLWLKESYTIGKLYVDGKYLCDTLEDKFRDLSKAKKVYGETAIPAGEYRVIMTYSPKFRREMPLLLNVPQFETVRIHPGNTADDTEGCILVGENKVKGGLINSRIHSDRLNEMIQSADGDVIIEIS